MTPEEMAVLHGTAFERGWSADEFRDLLDQPGVLAARTDQGFALARVITDEAEVLTIVVEKAARGSGAGKALLEALLKATRQAGAEDIFLEVAEDNEAARALYARAGFEETGRRGGYYRRDGKAVDALLLRRGL